MVKSSIKDKVVSWFIRNILMPQFEIFHYPGFVAESLFNNKKIIIREIILSESLLASLEETIGYEILYSVGKKFGYMYSYSIRLPTIRDLQKEKFLNFVYFFVRDIEGIYANKLSHKLNYSSRIISFNMDNYIICRKNGKGYIFSEGGIAGIWSYACQDPTIEAVQPKCQGRGDKECEVIAAPYKTLLKMGYKPIKCTKLEKLELDEQYLQFNQIRPTKWAKNSLKDLIDAGVFDYKHGQVTYNGERFFLCEASFMYILERELAKLKNRLKTLWDVSFDFGKKLAKISGKQDPNKFIMDFFPALGFGDILATSEGDKYKIYVDYFPWTKWANEIDFVMFRGLLSGVISGFVGKNIKLKKIEKDISSGFLSLYLSNY